MKIDPKPYLLGLLILSLIQVTAQDSSSNRITVTGYAEVYYLKDLPHAANHTRPGFIYSYNRTGEINLNLGYIKASYAGKTVRANAALAAGTYMNANFASEQGVFRNLYEANAGIRLSRHSNLWLDAGIFASHIGSETAVGKDNWNLTRSLLADNSPYYETGARISYTSHDHTWYLAALILNGWQRVTPAKGNSAPSFGAQVTYTPNKRITLNSSSFIGNDKPDSSRRMRYFHNFYGIFQLNTSLTALIGFDAGMEQKSKGSSSMNFWYSPMLLVKLTTSAKTLLAFRGEYYSDESGVIIATHSPNGFTTWGWSANFDVQISPHALWRIEARTLRSKDRIFWQDNTTAVNSHSFLSTAIAISF